MAARDRCGNESDLDRDGQLQEEVLATTDRTIWSSANDGLVMIEKYESDQALSITTTARPSPT
jgi:hypothetical protein